MHSTSENVTLPSDKRRIPIGLGDLHLSVGDHVAHFYRRGSEWLDLAAGFVGEGLKVGDKCVCVIRPGEHVDGLVERLRGDGMPVDAARSSGQLAIFAGKDNPEELQTALANALSDVPRVFPLLRWVGDMSWSLPLMPTVEKLMEWESSCNQVGDAPVVFLCQYDLSAFLGSVVMDAMKTHPLCIVGSTVHVNPYYQTAEEFLTEIRHRASTALE